MFRSACTHAMAWALLLAATVDADEPPALNPFAPRPPQNATEGETEPPTINPFRPAAPVREDALSGYLTTSDGEIHPGRIFMTRDKRLKIYDETLKRQREVPLRAVKQIECKVLREWMEKEWRFRELALDEKYYTGREYPAREYVHVITLHDGRTITGPLAEIIYVQPIAVAAASGSPQVAREEEIRKFILHKRDKGDFGDDLKSLHYVKLIKLGEEALEEGRKRAGLQKSTRPDDHQRLQGVWTAQTMEVDGRQAPAEVLARMQFTFEGEKLFIRGNAEDQTGEPQECTYTIDPSQAPKHLDFTPAGRQKPILAIYAIDGDRLTVCARHVSSDAGRPTQMATEPNAKLIRIGFKKRKP